MEQGGFEPPASRLPNKRSPTELQPLFNKKVCFKLSLFYTLIFNIILIDCKLNYRFCKQGLIIEPIYP